MVEIDFWAKDFPKKILERQAEERVTCACNNNEFFWGKSKQKKAEDLA